MSSISAQGMKDDKMMKKGDNPMVGGAAMYKTKNIVENAMNSKDHTTLVAAVKAAGLVDTLIGKGPFTVFAPTNSAFDALPAGTVDKLLKPENKAMLAKILTYHVVAGNMDSKNILKAIKKGNGKAMFKTVSGGILTASKDGKILVLTDEAGGISKITIADVKQSNGVIHVIDRILLPASWVYHGNIKGQVLLKVDKVYNPSKSMKVELLYGGDVKSTTFTDSTGWFYFNSVAAVESYSIRVNGESKPIKSVIDKTVVVPAFIIDYKK